MTVDSLWKDIYQGWKVGLKLAGESSGVGDWRMVTFIMGDEANIEKDGKPGNCFKTQYKFRENMKIVKRRLETNYIFVAAIWLVSSAFLV